MNRSAFPSESAVSSRSLSGLGLTAVATALHLAVITGQLPRRTSGPRHGGLLGQDWLMRSRLPVEPPVEAVCLPDDDAPSNPHQTFAAGRLALSAGVAVIALAIQLRIMQRSGARSR